jgi:hypothetical protein
MKRIIAITLTAITAGLSGNVLGDDHDGPSSRPWSAYTKPGVAMVENEGYREECGACHMAYPPGLLPAQSWERLMATLGDHFGENVELPEGKRISILNYLLNSAAGRVNYAVSNNMIRNVQGTPLRITELPYFLHEHEEIPKRFVMDNPQIRSFSNCGACHENADKGSFNEHEIHISGYVRHDD